MGADEQDREDGVDRRRQHRLEQRRGDRQQTERQHRGQRPGERCGTHGKSAERQPDHHEALTGQGGRQRNARPCTMSKAAHRHRSAGSRTGRAICRSGTRPAAGRRRDGTATRNTRRPTSPRAAAPPDRRYRTATRSAASQDRATGREAGACDDIEPPADAGARPDARKLIAARHRLPRSAPVEERTGWRLGRHHAVSARNRRSARLRACPMLAVGSTSGTWAAL